MKKNEQFIFAFLEKEEQRKKEERSGEKKKNGKKKRNGEEKWNGTKERWEKDQNQKKKGLMLGGKKRKKNQVMDGYVKTELPPETQKRTLASVAMSNGMRSGLVPSSRIGYYLGSLKQKS